LCIVRPEFGKASTIVRILAPQRARPLWKFFPEEEENHPDILKPRTRAIIGANALPVSLTLLARDALAPEAVQRGADIALFLEHEGFMRS
jgi:hypothetical protein